MTNAGVVALMPAMSSPIRRQTRRMADLNVVSVDMGPEPAALHVVLCHGYGAPREDLVGLAQPVLQALAPQHRTRVRFHFPGAPLDAPGGGGGAWWQLDMERLFHLAQGGASAVGARRQEIPEGAAKARRAVQATLAALLLQEKTTLDHVVLGGFSQGAMVTTDVTLRLEEAPAGLCILSGTLLMEQEWRPRAKARAGLPVVISHGTQDPLLPFADAEALRDLLKDAGMRVNWVPFNGPHTIVPPALAALAQMVTSLLERAQE